MEWPQIVYEFQHFNNIIMFALDKYKLECVLNVPYHYVWAVRACFPYALCISMGLFYAVKIGRVRFFAKKLDRARAELAIVPIPIMQIIVVVMFAFVMMHVQEILIPFDCQPCGRERWGGDKGPENAAFEVDVFCLAKTSQIICGESEHVFMKVVSYFLLLLLMAYAG